MQVDSISSVATNISTSPGIGQTKANTSGEQTTVKQREPRLVEDRKFNEEDVINAIEKANKDFIVYDRRLEFSIHEKTKQIMVKIIDVSTDEVIKELPPEKVLDMVAGVLEVAGIIVDKKV